MITRSKAGVFKPKLYSTINSHPVPEPDCVSDALKVPERKLAMQQEYDALIKNSTWSLVPKMKDMNMISTKWLFRVKYNKDGTVERYKARLVARGFQQTAGVDYFNTFSPVIKPATLRNVFTLAILKGWIIQHVDINNAFLHGELKETVYITQPEGFQSSAFPHHICKLNKALYGLKQAPKAWYDQLKGFLIEYGLVHSTTDHCLFHGQKNGNTLILLVYVDDILITSDDATQVQMLITDLNLRFSLKHMGVVNHFLGIEALVTPSSITLTQTKYIKDILNKTSLQHCSSCPTPICPGLNLSLHDSEPFSQPTLYRSVIGTLQYLTITRPNISFVVNKISQFLNAPTQNHWKACKRILRYLKGSLAIGLLFTPVSDFRIEGFSDADYATNIDDRRSTSGYCIKIGSNLIAWCSRKQSVVVRSSTKAEYRSLALATTDIYLAHYVVERTSYSTAHSFIVVV